MAVAVSSGTSPAYRWAPRSARAAGGAVSIVAPTSRDRAVAGLFTLLALVAVLAATPAHAGQVFTATVVRIVDGDTIHVQYNGRTEKVRYIGMDTPETHHPVKREQPGGREATVVNRRLVTGKTVQLELDVQERDRYGRLLAYVYVGPLMVNAELLRLGYAQVMTIPPNVKYASLFVKLQREAREAGRGLWARP